MSGVCVARTGNNGRGWGMGMEKKREGERRRERGSIRLGTQEEELFRRDEEERTEV